MEKVNKFRHLIEVFYLGTISRQLEKTLKFYKRFS